MTEVDTDIVTPPQSAPVPFAVDPGGDPEAAGAVVPADDAVTDERDNGGVPLATISWTVTAVAFAIAALILLIDAYYGYAAVTFIVAGSAAVNLF